MGIRETFHPRRILHAPGAISVHEGVWLDESRTRALLSGAESFADRVTAAEEGGGRDTEKDFRKTVVENYVLVFRNQDIKKRVLVFIFKSESNKRQSNRPKRIT